ncbi:NAD(P)-binding domain-containing protein [Microbacterium sp. ET2]|uniref:NAD(P)-binding domain-containing protein n=1 Tax=Microbacterium albipurpureum TaxID=3050384 RepID=UPI00259D0353|nr:NAD(P)-binding domain-containing protein [Microbacterium sp. ET2 (Ac-2212)]WJL96628.1 NAD(P)-binding domain-containing protein [Microbacterium sp. ET2 (Ac-2212)]
METTLGIIDVVVVGAGQAGLSASHHLQRRGFVNALDDPDAARTYLVVDANSQPGGAWSHRWESLTIATVNGIFALPDFPQPRMRDSEPSRTAVPRYFAAYESAHQIRVLRPVHVRRIRRIDENPAGLLSVESDQGSWAVRAVINATGTWNNPVKPAYPGAESFRGRQLHTREYTGYEHFAGQRVAVVGAGISAVQHLEEVSRVAETFWYTRRPPQWLDTEFEAETTGRATIAKVVADVEAGRPTGSVVSYTGLGWTSYARAARDRGVLDARPMFSSIAPAGVWEADGAFTELDAIVWATGFKADLAHLDPLGLRNAQGGIQVHGTQAARDPRVHLIGFGPSQSTVGANRAGRDAVVAVQQYLSASAEGFSSRLTPA